MAKKLIKKPVLKKAQNGVTEAPMKSKDRLNVAGGFYEPSRRNQIIDSTFTPKGINQAKLKEHAATIRKMSNDREYLSKEEALRPKPEMKKGGMIKRADGSMSKRGLWDNIRANKGSGKKPTAAMLKQEKKIKAQTKKK
jgi:hypothetical protein